MPNALGDPEMRFGTLPVTSGTGWVLKTETEKTEGHRNTVCRFGEDDCYRLNTNLRSKNIGMDQSEFFKKRYELYCIKKWS